MKTNQIQEFYQLLKSDNLSFIYQGDFSDGITDKIIALSEYSLEDKHEMGEIRRKVSFVIIECFQNIVRHGNDARNKSNRTVTSPGLFSTRNTKDCIYIASANLIEKENVAQLTEKLESLNKLNKEQKKDLHIDILKNGKLSDKGGAGLGFIEMARKSENPLEFTFENENDKLSLFYLMLKMHSKGVVSEKYVSMQSVIESYDLMRKENILMIYKGDFSQETVIPMLKMVEHNLNKHKEGLHFTKKIVLVLIEMLQNISKHAIELNGKRDSIFMIGKNNNKYIICTGNMVDSASSEKLKTKIDAVNNLNPEDLVVLYKKKLKENASTERGAGLGIIDIARESTEKIVFDLQPVEGGLQFFSLCVQI